MSVRAKVEKHCSWRTGGRDLDSAAGRLFAIAGRAKPNRSWQVIVITEVKHDRFSLDRRDTMSETDRGTEKPEVRKLQC